VIVFLQILSLRRARDRRMGLLIGAALLLVGMFVTGTSLAAAYRASLPNPVPATPASLVRGRQIYQANCASCHGVSGRGDGPAGFLLHPPPADLRVHMAAGHTDAQLFDWITHGVSGTGMPAFGQKLSREDIWNVINYIRTFAAAPAAAQ
jgi:mono/diheme cytochrome c family protein